MEVGKEVGFLWCGNYSKGRITDHHGGQKGAEAQAKEDQSPQPFRDVRGELAFLGSRNCHVEGEDFVGWKVTHCGGWCAKF